MFPNGRHGPVFFFSHRLIYIRLDRAMFCRWSLRTIGFPTESSAPNRQGACQRGAKFVPQALGIGFLTLVPCSVVFRVGKWLGGPGSDYFFFLLRGAAIHSSVWFFIVFFLAGPTPLIAQKKNQTPEPNLGGAKGRQLTG